MLRGTSLTSRIASDSGTSHSGGEQDEETRYTHESALEQRFEALIRSYHRKDRQDIFLATFLSVSTIFLSLSVLVFLQSQIAGAQHAAADTTQAIIGANPAVVTLARDSKVLTQFLRNQAIAEVEFKVAIDSSGISHHDTPNCRTPEVPPSVNGCGFVLLPYAMSIPTRGVLFQSIQIWGTFPEGNSLQISVKDYQNNELKQNVALVKSLQLGEEIPLPLNLATTQGLYLRFWSAVGQSKIERIVINYFNSENLEPVTAVAPAENFNAYTEAELWWDRNGNKVWEPEIDVQWLCQRNFPGVKKIVFDNEGNFHLIRDESCFTDLKPDSWYTDNQQNALPHGHWLLKSSTGQAFSFEV
jgi:hypothetical protein